MNFYKAVEKGMKMSNSTFNISHIAAIKDEGLRALVQALWMWKAKDGIKLVQRAVRDLGGDIVVDGWLGDKSIAALDKLKSSEVHAALVIRLADMEEAKDPAYLTIAKAELGVKETKGKRHNKRVLKYHAVSGGFKTDEVPWCGSFVNWVMKEAGFNKTVKYPARAKSWLNFGISSVEPVLGAIAVKSRSGGGHVCFVVGKSRKGKYLYCLGGNQGDAVTIRKYKKSVFMDFRIPGSQTPIKLAVHEGAVQKAGREA